MNNTTCTGGHTPATVSFEVMPPRNPDAAPKFWGTVDRLIASGPDFVSVTYGAAGGDRSSARAVVHRLVRNAPVQPIAHLTCVGTTPDQAAAIISDYLDDGVRTFLALRGDPPRDNPDWKPCQGEVSSATQLISLIRAVETRRCMEHPGAALRAAFKPLTIAVAAFASGNAQSGTTQDQEVERLLVKQAAGASFAITQLLWDPEDYLSFVEQARSSGVTIPIVPGILPPTDPDRVRRTRNITGSDAPEWIIRELEKAGTPEEAHVVGTRIGADIAHGVMAGGAPGLHVYTFNKSEPAIDLVSAVGLLDPR